jgi:hypothetical protein
MKDTDIIDHHQTIRETVGYEILEKIELEDMPKFIEFLKVVQNYQRMNRVKRANERFGRPGELIEEDLLFGEEQMDEVEAARLKGYGEGYQEGLYDAENK